MDYAKKRQRLVDWLRSQLMGPVSEKDEIKGIHPIERYPTGTLFPIILGEEGLDPADDEDRKGHRLGA
ncbi:hypothetical protein DJ031_17030 [bacterium endosymbiont of Escarpia laminata]|nr:MAG: hypothetical protein DJ031_17030 [bacterium endosymbiont of Escarpia laminata]